MAALNLTIDKAPTKPRDNAIDDFTIVMIKVVAKHRGIKIRPMYSQISEK